MTVDNEKLNQPRALYLADVLSAAFECNMEWYEWESARELRRLHAENEELKDLRDELLESLIDMVDYYGTASANVQQLDAAKSAIAKAEGEQA